MTKRWELGEWGEPHKHTWSYLTGSYERRCDACGKREPKHWTGIVGSALFVLIAVVLYLAFLLATAWGISDYFGPPPSRPPLSN